MTGRKMRIVTIMARHGTSQYADAPAQIRELFVRQFQGVEHDMLIVDNALPIGHRESLSCGATLIGGGAIAREFSAWDSAIEFLGDDLLEYDFVNLATAAFRQLYVAYLDRFNSTMLGLVRGRAVAIGHIDYYNSPVALLGMSCQSWIRTSFVFLPPHELRLLGSLISVSVGDRFFSEDPLNPFLAEAPVSEGYRQNIIGWLTGEGTGQGTLWHSRFALSAQTLPLFQAKAVAIFNEQMLSNRLRAKGCSPVDATWLASQSNRLKPGEPLGAIPDWRVQLVARDADPAPRSIII
ncbi:hypothetical protein [Variovorax soli]|uniref:hypothetical protein n=1 Tax=Variovorax soli TaxID=376815 RepID=UPI000837B798|nr:hypothetical protein [Variovorax soli]